MPPMTGCAALLAVNPSALWAQFTGAGDAYGAPVFEAFPNRYALMNATQAAAYAQGAGAYAGGVGPPMAGGGGPMRRLAGGPKPFSAYDTDGNGFITEEEYANNVDYNWYTENIWFVTVCHIAMFVEFLAFSQSDIYKLRVLEVLANVFLMTWVIGAHWGDNGNKLNTILDTECHGLWSVVHVLIIVFRLSQERIREMHLVREMTPEDKTVRETWFKHYSNIQFAELRRKYKWVHRNPGEPLLTQGLAHHKLFLIFQGEASIFLREEDDPVMQARLGNLSHPKHEHSHEGALGGKDDEGRGGEPTEHHAKKHRQTMAPKKHRRHAEPGETFVGEVKAGQYIGEMAYFTREPASASVRARTTMILLEWDIAEVRHLANHHSHNNPAQAEAFAMLPSLFCRDMANRLQSAQNEKAGGKNKVRPEAEGDSQWDDDDDGHSIVYHRRVSRML